jgi:hypothetical protein
MRWTDFDWRFSSTKRILEALSDALKEVEQGAGEAQESHEIDEILELTEGLLGIAFTTAQTYICGTVSDVNRLLKPLKPVTKEQLLKEYGDQLPASEITKLELCNAAANYFKHHDEWADWSEMGRHQKTVALLQTVGITETDSFPCRKAANILWSNDEGSNLEPLLRMISDWRGSVIAAFR